MSIFKKRKTVKASEPTGKPMYKSTFFASDESASASGEWLKKDDEKPDRPLWFRLYQKKQQKQVQPYSPVLMVRASDVQALHPNVFDPEKADIMVGGHWFATVNPFDEVVFSVYGVVLENDNPAANADWQRLKNDKRVKNEKMKNERMKE